MLFSLPPSSPGTGQEGNWSPSNLTLRTPVPLGGGVQPGVPAPGHLRPRINTIHCSSLREAIIRQTEVITVT